MGGFSGTVLRKILQISDNELISTNQKLHIISFSGGVKI